MSINLVNLSCPIVGKVNYMAAGTVTKAGKTMSYPKLSCRIKLPDDKVSLNGGDYPLADQTLWLNINVPKSKGGAADEGRIQTFCQAVAGGKVYALVTEGHLTSWQGQQGPKYEVKCDLRNFRLDAQPQRASNVVIVAGTLASQGQGWANLEEEYQTTIMENGKPVGREWKKRSIPVLIGGDLPTSLGAQVLVYGRIATKLWTGNEWESGAYVVAKEII